MKNHSPLPFPIVPVIARPDLASSLAGPKKAGWFWPLPAERILLKQNAPPPLARRKVEAPLIYAVDDLPSLTDLYCTVLEETGYRVRTFNDRTAALAALKTTSSKPSLLIMDYLGHSMPTDWFIQHCRAVHPELQILLASGMPSAAARFSRAAPDRFIQKPFTLDELRREVQAALAL